MRRGRVWATLAWCLSACATSAASAQTPPDSSATPADAPRTTDPAEAAFRSGVEAFDAGDYEEDDVNCTVSVSLWWAEKEGLV